MFIFDNCNIMQEMWVLIFDCQLSLYSTAQVENFLNAIDSFGRNGCGLSPKNICLDSAHDNIPTYKLLEHWGINALIDINGRSKSSAGATDDITFNKEGHPLCRPGHEMCSWGSDPIKDAHKYRCPLRCGRIGNCPHETECSPGRYGRTV